ncbi:hypothetical protein CAUPRSCDRAFT_12066 [Caulochytrium protostelioides]|uniref:Uncharacterized protein n=1 Tax=Caulochytrium protostelioides TaxID=1555241 RepID=A0A4P9WUI8_9FUNG|nr:hypothetical protein CAUPRSCDRAFT_12066 [Caulochytrium protostelioides]
MVDAVPHVAGGPSPPGRCGAGARPLGGSRPFGMGVAAVGREGRHAQGADHTCIIVVVVDRSADAAVGRRGAADDGDDDRLGWDRHSAVASIVRNAVDHVGIAAVGNAAAITAIVVGDDDAGRRSAGREGGDRLCRASGRVLGRRGRVGPSRDTRRVPGPAGARDVGVDRARHAAAEPLAREGGKGPPLGPRRLRRSRGRRYLLGIDAGPALFAQVRPRRG